VHGDARPLHARHAGPDPREEEEARATTCASVARHAEHHLRVDQGGSQGSVSADALGDEPDGRRVAVLAQQPAPAVARRLHGLPRSQRIVRDCDAGRGLARVQRGAVANLHVGAFCAALAASPRCQRGTCPHRSR
jgi:hypothetical protein